MTRDFPESDWKVFRQLRSLALARYCERIIDEIAQISADTEKSAHERYLNIYTLIQERDRTLADAFNNPRRSTALLQLLTIHSHGLITEDEIGAFSEKVRDAVSRFSAQRA